MNATSAKPQIATGLIWKTVDDDAIVVSPNLGTVRVLNGIGSIIWEMLSKGNELPEIELRLVANYDVNLEQAQNDLRAFLQDLRAHNLIIWDS